MSAWKSVSLSALYAILAFSPLLARGQDCANYSATLINGELMATADTLSQTALWNGQLVTAGGSSLTLLSLADPMHPAPTATVTLPGAVTDLALTDHFAVIGLAGDGFVVVDLNGPSLLAPPTAAPAHAVAASGTLLATASTTGLIQIFDLTTPAGPALLGSLALGHPVSDLAFDNGIVFAGGDEGLFCIGTSVPTAPALVGDLITGHNGIAYPEIAPHFTHLALAGNQLTVLGAQFNDYCDDWGCYPVPVPQLFTIDVSAPDAPQYTAWRDLQGNGVRLWDGMVLVPGDVRLTIIDGMGLSTLAQLTVDPLLRDAIGGNSVVYAAGGTAGLQVVNATYPQTIPPSTTYGNNFDQTVGAKGRFTLDMLDNSNGNWRSIDYALFDLLDPLNPVMVKSGSRGGMNTHPGVTLFDAQGDLAVIGTVTDSWDYPYLAFVDDYSQQPPASATLGNADQVLLDGAVAWVQLGSTLTAKSLADFASPVDLASLTIPGGSLYRLGGVTTVVTSSDFYLLDLTNPQAPAVRGSIPIPYYSQISVAMPDSLLLLGMGQNDDGYTLGLLDVGDPDHPTWVSQTTGQGRLQGLGLMGDVVVVLNGTSLRTLSVTDPANPVWLSSELTLARPQGTPVIHDNLAYVNTYNTGLVLVDLTVPSLPRVRGSAGGETAFMRAWNQAILTGNSVFQLDCADAVPTLVQSLSAAWDGGALRLDLHLAGSSSDLRLVNRGLNGDRVIPWLSSSEGTVVARDQDWEGAPGSTLTYVIQLQTTANAWVDLAATTTEIPGFTLHLKQAVPNPFNPTTNLAFTLDRPGQIVLAVYSVAGERVRTLLDEPMGAGPHQSIWDGANDRGQPVAAGIYFARLQAGGRQSTTKMALIK